MLVICFHIVANTVVTVTNIAVVAMSLLCFHMVATTVVAAHLFVAFGVDAVVVVIIPLQILM